MNRMCLDCKCLGVSCNGKNNHVYTNCVYRKSEKGDADLSPSIPIISREVIEEHGVLISKIK